MYETNGIVYIRFRFIRFYYIYIAQWNQIQRDEIIYFSRA